MGLRRLFLAIRIGSTVTDLFDNWVPRDQQLGLGCMIPFLDSNKQTQTSTHKAWQRLAGGRAQN